MRELDKRAEPIIDFKAANHEARPKFGNDDGVVGEVVAAENDLKALVFDVCQNNRDERCVEAASPVRFQDARTGHLKFAR